MKLWLLTSILLITGCSAQRNMIFLPSEPELVSIHIIDREGMTEAISNQERLKSYSNVDFLSPQPYQKVLRVYERDSEGVVHAYITTYHPNGQPKQYLEVINHRAYGAYNEWHPNGSRKVDAQIIEGVADISLAAEKSWQFDGLTYAYNETNQKIATIPYCRGTLQGIAIYYHPNGNIWKEIPYENNLISGEMKIYLENGELLQKSCYKNGIKEGLSQKFWPGEKSAAKEFYTEGLLIQAAYFNSEGEKLAEINDGKGFRIVFGKDFVSEKHEFRDGLPEGSVHIFDQKGALIKQYQVKKGFKHGEELIFYPKHPLKPLQTKLSLAWYEGRLRGLSKSWYDNGIMESQKEISDNKKSGISTAWYRDGSLMMIEEYDQDKLIKGDYFRKSDRQSISQVINGEGIATFYDPEGNYLRKVNYFNGKPDE